MDCMCRYYSTNQGKKALKQYSIMDSICRVFTLYLLMIRDCMSCIGRFEATLSYLLYKPTCVWLLYRQRLRSPLLSKVSKKYANPPVLHSTIFCVDLQPSQTTIQTFLWLRWCGHFPKVPLTSTWRLW